VADLVIDVVEPARSRAYDELRDQRNEDSVISPVSASNLSVACKTTPR
jgi:hypothetical protein